MKKLYLALLWHMHQPYYKDKGVYKLPWVFMHAIKDYYDMPRYCELAGAKATFNLVPSLMMQLEDYADRNVADEFLQAIRKAPEDLTLKEIEKLVPQLFMAQAEFMIGPYPNYRRLYNCYIKTNDPLQFSAREIRDLCVHCLLAWTGMQTRREILFVGKLLEKGSDFTEVEKHQLLDELHDWVGRILIYYKRLQDEGLLEISVTPFYHPILPLLIDLDAAKEAWPEVPMPKVPEDFQGFATDAAWQVSAAVEYYENKFGCKPRGMWPAEGSISTETLQLIARHGLNWAASDEDVLGGSLVKDLKMPNNRSLIYRKYLMDTLEGQHLNLFFRDKKLSDLLGFTYANMNTKASVTDFMAKLRLIYDNATEDVLVPVILDGENAWEYYPDGAYPFFTEFYKQLTSQDWLAMLTMSEAVDKEELTARRLNAVRAGSWIYGTFSTWIGHPEKNRGWEVLTQTAADVTPLLDKLSVNKQNELRTALHVAQGSDWWWWYGDDHFSLQAGEYDSLFRAQLIRVYQLAGLNVPENLYTPIKAGGKAGLLRASTNFIAPVLDGKITSFFEWMGSGLFDVIFDMGSMHMDDRILRLFYWGFGKDNLYLRLDGDFAKRLNQGYKVEIDIELGAKTYVVKLALADACTVSGDLQNDVSAALGDILEIAIAKKALELNDYDIIKLTFKVTLYDVLVERAPAYNYVEIEAGLSDTYNWLA